MAEEKKPWWYSTYDAFDTFLRVPGTVTRKGAHVRDGIDLKRVMIMVVVALVPAALFGMYNVGLQTSTVYGLEWGFWQMFFYGLLRMLPLFVVSYVVGLAIEFASSQIRGEEVNEGYLVTGFLIPLIVPVDVPLWMLALAVAFSVIFVKEVFGGTGMNIWNPALVARAFLFFSYPSSMSGSSVWVSKTWVPALKDVDAISAATPLAIAHDGAFDAATGAVGQYSFMDMVWGFIPGSTGETSVIAILLGGILLVWSGGRHRRSLLLSAGNGRLPVRLRIHGHRPCHRCPDGNRQVDLRLPGRCPGRGCTSVEPRLHGRHDARHPAHEHLCSAHRPLRSVRAHQPQGQESCKRLKELRYEYK